MKTIKETKKRLDIEYNKFCLDLWLNKKHKLSKEDFAKHYIEHYIGCFGFFDNDYFIEKDIEKIKNEIIEILD